MDPYQSPWGDVDETAKVSPGKKQTPSSYQGSSKFIFWIIGVFAVIGIGVVAFYFFFFANQPTALAVTISKPDKILAGAPFTISIALANNSGGSLTDARASLTLPDGMSFIGHSADQRSLEQIAGDLGPGEVKSQTFFVIATGAPQTVAHLSAAATYGTGGSSSRFESREETDAFIGSPAVDVKLATPQSIYNGKDFDLTVNYTNNSDQNLTNFEIALGLPDAYQFKTASVNPSGAQKNVWNLGTIAPGQAGTLTVTGSLTGTEGSFYPITASATAVFSGTSYPMGSQNASIAIAYSPLSVSIVLADHPSASVVPGDMLHYVLTYKNNSNTTFQNVAITANLTGAMYDYSSMRSGAAFDSVNHVLRWFAANAPALANVAPGESGTVDFRISLVSDYPIKSPSDKNFTLGVSATIGSQTVPTGTDAQETTASASLENKVQGKLTLISKTLWRDAASGVINVGPYPPVVNKPTQYTVHWILKNYETDAVNIHVTAQLESTTRFTGVVKSNISTMPKYDPTSGVITWDIPYLAANTGVLNTPPEAIFQIENVPAANQVGFRVPILSAAQETAQDAWSGGTPLSSVPEVTTDIPDDTTISQQTNRAVRAQ